MANVDRCSFKPGQFVHFLSIMVQGRWQGARKLHLEMHTMVALLICMLCTSSFHTQARLPGVQGRTEGHGVSGIPVKWTRSTAENTQVHMHCTHIVRMHMCTHRHSGKRYKTRLFPGERWLMMFSNARFKLRFFSCTLTNTFLLCVP